jgi:hypothetical protein
MTLGELDSRRHGHGIPVGIDLRDRRLELLGDRRWKLLPRELELLEDQDLRRADAKVQKLAERNQADGGMLISLLRACPEAGGLVLRTQADDSRKLVHSDPRLEPGFCGPTEHRRCETLSSPMGLPRHDSTKLTVQKAHPRSWANS